MDQYTDSPSPTHSTVKQNVERKQLKIQLENLTKMPEVSNTQLPTRHSYKDFTKNMQTSRKRLRPQALI